MSAGTAAEGDVVEIRSGCGRSRAARLVALALAACFVGLLATVRPTMALSLSPRCGVPDSLVVLPDQLRRTKNLLAGGKSVRVLAIGSSSTRGVGASSPARAYPARFEDALERRFPGVDVVVLNDGVNGELAAETLERLKQHVASFAPDLVVWQVGTNDAMAQVDPEAFTRTLRDGIAWVGARGVDLILMDPQYCPRVAKEPVYSTYVELVAKVAGETGVPLMRRYAAMRYWASRSNGPQLMLASDSFHLNDRGYACIAEVLAEGLARLIASR